jgi:hypothetical protein
VSRGYADLALVLVELVLALFAVMIPARRLLPAPRPALDDLELATSRPRQARRTYAPGVDWLIREFPEWDVRLVGARRRLYVATCGADLVRASTVAEAVEGMRAADARPLPSPVRPYLSR